MRIVYSQKDGEKYLPRAEFRKLVQPISRTSRNSKLLVKIFLYKRKHFRCKECGRHLFKEDLQQKDRWRTERPDEQNKGVTKILTYYRREDIPADELAKAKFIRQGTCEDCGSTEFREVWSGSGIRGNFRSFVDHYFYKNEEKYFRQGKRGIITLKIWPNTKPRAIFSLFAHEFYHWRQSNVVHYGRGKYSEKKAGKWADKVTIKSFGEPSGGIRGSILEAVKKEARDRFNGKIK